MTELLAALGPERVTSLFLLSLLWISIVLVFIVFIIRKVVRSGMVDYNGHGLRVNSLDLVERRLRFAHTFIMASKVYFNNGLDDVGLLKLELLLEKIYDEFMIRIVVNHMEDEEGYITRVWDFIFTLTQSIATPGSFTPEYQDKALELTKELVRKLVKLKQ